MSDQEFMISTIVKLEDIHNSQESLIEKVGAVQVDLLNNPDSELEQKLNALNAGMSTIYREIQVLQDTYMARYHAM